MATVTKGRTFTNEEVTASKLNTLVDDATVTGIVNADIAAAAAIAGTKIAPNFGTQNIITTGDIYTTAWTDYFATSTIVGWSAGKTGAIYTKRIGDMVYCCFYITGTSDSETTSFTIPSTASGTISPDFYITAQDNTGTEIGGVGEVSGGSKVVNLYKNSSYGTWTSSGTKSIRGQFFYRAQD